MERTKVMLLIFMLLGINTAFTAEPEVTPAQNIEKNFFGKIPAQLSDFWQKLLDKGQELRTGIPSQAVPSCFPEGSPTAAPTLAEANVTPAQSTSAFVSRTIGIVFTALAARQVYNHFWNRNVISDITQNPSDIAWIQLHISQNDSTHHYVRKFYPQENGAFNVRLYTETDGQGIEKKFSSLGDYLGEELQNTFLKDIDDGDYTATVEITIVFENGAIDRRLTPFSVTLPHTKNTSLFGQTLWNNYLAGRMRVVPYTQAECNTLKADDTKKLVKVTAKITHHQAFSTPAQCAMVAVPTGLIIAGVKNPYVLQASLMATLGWNYLNRKNPVFETTLPKRGNQYTTTFSAANLDDINKKIEKFEENANRQPEQKYTIVYTYDFKNTTTQEIMSYRSAPEEIIKGCALDGPTPVAALTEASATATTYLAERTGQAKAYTEGCIDAIGARATRSITSLMSRIALPALPDWLRPAETSLGREAGGDDDA